MEKLKINYICSSWQGLLQQAVYLVSRGYYNYCLTQYPENKRDRWSCIDQKMIEKYRCNLSKYQRARFKNKGIANYYYLRWDALSLMMHTSGQLPEGITADDKFYDCKEKKNRLVIPIGIIKMQIMPPGDPNNIRVTVRLTKESYRDVKSSLLSACRSQNKYMIIKEYDRLNGLPAWAGIVEQKRMIAGYVAHQARKNHIPLQINELRINTYRKVYPVWQ